MLATCYRLRLVLTCCTCAGCSSWRSRGAPGPHRPSGAPSFRGSAWQGSCPQAHTCAQALSWGVSTSLAAQRPARSVAQAGLCGGGLLSGGLGTSSIHHPACGPSLRAVVQSGGSTSSGPLRGGDRVVGIEQSGGSTSLTPRSRARSVAHLKSVCAGGGCSQVCWGTPRSTILGRCGGVTG